MKKAIRWAVLILILSGWAAFAFMYATCEKEKARLNTRISELEGEINSYLFIGKNIGASSEKIDDIISTLRELQISLDNLKEKMEKGANDESSQDRE